MGHYDTKHAADLPLPARQGRPALRARRPLLPGAPSAARSSTTSTSSRRARPDRHQPPAPGGAKTLGARRATGCPPATRCTQPTGRRRRRPADPGLPDGTAVDYAAGLRRLRGQHRAALQPAVRRRPEDPAHRRREVPQHRRPAQRRRRVLELVLRRLGRRRGRPPRAAVPVPPPAVQLLRRLRPRPARPRAPAGRDAVPHRRAARARCRRSASSSRTARRTSTPATPASPTAATTSSTCSRRSPPARRPRTRSSS